VSPPGPLSLLTEPNLALEQVVTVTVEVRERDGTGTLSKLQLVDLAGSERVLLSQAEGQVRALPPTGDLGYRE
jgi:hypothetical protein